MYIDLPFLELILKIISYSILIFGIWAVIEQYTAGRLISKLEIRLHYFTNHNGERVLHAPAVREPKVWEVFDVITSVWVLYRARHWAKSSESRRIIVVPPRSPRSPLLEKFLTSRAQMFQRMRIYLQANVQKSGTWVQRASNSVSHPEAEGDETEYQFFLSLEHNNPEAKAIFVHIFPVATIDEIVSSNGAFANTIHPNWLFTEEQVQILTEGCKHLQQIREQPDNENNLTIIL